MMVSPELISASKAPSANPLKTCETKFGQLIMKCDHRAWISTISCNPAYGRKKWRRGLPDAAAPWLLCRLGVVAEVAAKRVRLLHQALAGNDFNHVVIVFLVLHVLLQLALDDDDRANALVVFLAVVHVAHQRRNGLALFIGLDHVGRVETAGLLAHPRPVREADI